MNYFHQTQFTVHVRRLAWLVCLLYGVLQFTGCAVGPKYRTPTVTAPPAYKEIGNWKTAQPNDQNLGGNWWELFHDPQLNALEQEITVSNQNLKAAVAQYQQSRAALRYVRADYYPTVSAGLSATREKYSGNRPPASSIFNGRTFNDFVMPLNLSYQVNAWGRVSKNVESYREQAQASAGDLAVVNLSMHAQLAVDYFAARTLDAEEKLLRDTVAQYQQAFQLNEDRYQGGLASEVEVEQARTILETTRAQMIDVGVARAQYEHAVAAAPSHLEAHFALGNLRLLQDRVAEAATALGRPPLAGPVWPARRHRVPHPQQLAALRRRRGGGVGEDAVHAAHRAAPLKTPAPRHGRRG